MIKNVAILWEDLLRAFNNIELNRLYFLDKFTGEIFFVSADMDDGFWQEMEQHHERFVEIPPIDRSTEKQLITGFIESQEDKELRELLEHAMSGRPPFAKPSDILSFFPDQEAKLAEMRDSFISDRVKNWLMENNMLSISSFMSAVH